MIQFVCLFAGWWSSNGFSNRACRYRHRTARIHSSTTSTRPDPYYWVPTRGYIPSTRSWISTRTCIPSTRTYVPSWTGVPTCGPWLSPSRRWGLSTLRPKQKVLHDCSQQHEQKHVNCSLQAMSAKILFVKFGRPDDSTVKVHIVEIYQIFCTADMIWCVGETQEVWREEIKH